MISRREFLKDSAMFSAAAAALGGVPAFAADAKRAKKVAANDRIHVAVIGFNGQGAGHLRAHASSPDTIVTHVCDVDSRLAKKGIKTVEDIQKTPPEYVQDLRRIMDNKEIHAVSIATPNHWHALAAIWAVQAGKDVYVEKPISHNVMEGRRIVDFARKLGRIVQCGTQSRSTEGMRQVIDYIHAGKIGKVTLARGICYKPRGSIGPKMSKPAPEGVDYDIWLGPAPAKQMVDRRNFHYDWHWFWDYGNGDLGNQGIHEMDKARWGLNKNTLPNTAFSLGGRFGYTDAGETANTQVCVFDYGDSELIFEVRGLATKPLLGLRRPGNIWYGTDGYIVSDSYSGGVVFSPKGEQITKFNGGGSHFANFIKAVRSRKHTDLNADCEDGHLSSALCHLGNISYRLGKEQPATSTMDLSKEGKESVGRMLEHLKENKMELDSLQVRIGRHLKLDPAAERFTNDSEANLLLTREYRKGFVVPEKA